MRVSRRLPSTIFFSGGEERRTFDIHYFVYRDADRGRAKVLPHTGLSAARLLLQSDARGVYCRGAIPDADGF